MGVNIAKHSTVRFNNLLDLDVDEEIEGINVLFDQSFDLQKRRQ